MNKSNNNNAFPKTVFNPALEVVIEAARQFESPLYLYSEEVIQQRLGLVKAMPAAFGLLPRFAMKASPNGAILKQVLDQGFGIDASSPFEAQRALRVGFTPAQISLTAQELPENLAEFLSQGFDINCCSLSQLELVGKAYQSLKIESPHIGIRINPGLGSGHSNRTNVGGPASGFGIWHEHLDQIKDLCSRYQLKVTRVHSHIGSGADPLIWQRCAQMTLSFAKHFPERNTISLGGGFKVARIEGEPEADLHNIGLQVAELFRQHAEETGCRCKLEVEPGAFLMAPCSVIVSKVIDVINTGKEGYQFIKVNTGMTEIVRPALYGAQHPLAVVPVTNATQSRPEKDYLVIGHCCESGDILTPAPGDPEALKPRRLLEAQVGDLLVIGSTGAYTAGMSCVNYNSFPEAAQVLYTKQGKLKLIKKRQTFDQMLENEIAV